MVLSPHFIHLIDQREMENIEHNEKQIPPSEMVNSERWGQAGFQREGSGSPPKQTMA
jgi:hypothetical protein